MSVRVVENKLQVGTLVFETRFDDGWRFLDHCGEAVSRIRKHDAKWKSLDVNPQAGDLVHQPHHLALKLNVSKAVFNRLNADPISQDKAKEVVGHMARDVEGLMPIITDAFQIPNTIRVGARFSFLASADSWEDAERFLVTATQSPLSNEISRSTNSEPCSGHFRMTFDEDSTGYRRNISIAAVRIGESDAELTGLATDKDDGKAGVLVDVDTYTRPTSGHFPEAGRFIQNSYTRSFRQAFDILRWIGDQQRR